MSSFKIKQIKSSSGGTKIQLDTLKTLGLGKIGSESVKPDRPEFRGMLRSVAHLVTVEEVK